MPYITKEDRKKFEKAKYYEIGCETDVYPISYLGRTIESAGEMNYVFTRIIKEYFDNLDHPVRYQDLNDVLGVLECCKQEFYRRIIIPYEENKMKDHGDV